MKNIFAWIKTPWLWLQRSCSTVKAGIMRRVRVLNPQGNLRLVSLPTYLRELQTNQVGAVSFGMLETLFASVVLIVVVIIFLYQQGLPMIIEATSNTTALTEAGATADQVSWAEFAGYILVIVLIVGLILLGIRSMKMGGGGQARWRRKRR